MRLLLMSDVKLFKISGNGVQELTGDGFALEKKLQTLIERNLETFLGVTFLETEFVTTGSTRGFIDTIGIDENNCPVIIEYKRSKDENVINQGLFYMDWLLEHKEAFELLVIKKLGSERAEKIEWSIPRLVCIAGSFTKYDEHAVNQMHHNIELIRYKRFGEDLLLFDLVNSNSPKSVGPPITTKGQNNYTTISEYMDKASTELINLIADVKAELLAFGDDIQEKTLKFYIAFKRIKNYACLEISIQNNLIHVYLKVDPKSITLEKGFSRDVTNIGHFGTGNMELTIKNHDDLKKALPLFRESYEIS